MTLPAWTFEPFQVAYVTSDLDRAIRSVGALYGAAKFQVNRDVKIQTAGGAASAHFALAFVGSRQLEIIEPCGGADAVYREALPATGFAVRLHHLGQLITDAAAWQSVVASVAAAGLATPVGGTYAHDGAALMHYLYADTRAQLGHYLEFMHQTKAGRDLFSAVPRY